MPWPFLTQILHRKDGTGLEARSAKTRAIGPKHSEASVARSVCPYCAVGCGQLVYHQRGPPDFDRRRSRVADLARPPLPEGRRQLRAADASRASLTTVRYRRPGARRWEDLDLETAMDMIADRVWASRERSFVEERGGRTLMHTHRDRAHRRRDAGQRRELSDQEALHRRPRHGVPQQSGPHMT